MTNVISALTARSQFQQIMKRASQNGERFVVDRNGEPKLIIMSIQDYVKAVAPPPAWLEEIWAESRLNGTDKLTMREINAEVAAVRREHARKSKTKRPLK